MQYSVGTTIICKLNCCCCCELKTSQISFALNLSLALGRDLQTASFPIVGKTNILHFSYWRTVRAGHKQNPKKGTHDPPIQMIGLKQNPLTSHVPHMSAWPLVFHLHLRCMSDCQSLGSCSHGTQFDQKHFTRKDNFVFVLDKFSSKVVRSPFGHKNKIGPLVLTILILLIPILSLAISSLKVKWLKVNLS